MRKWILLGVGVLVVYGMIVANAGEREREAEHEETAALLDDSASRGWEYKRHHDAMRGTDTDMAFLAAQGGITKWQPKLIVQKSGGQYDAAIRSSYEQGGERPSCLSGRDWHVNVKFDGGPVTRVECEMGMDAGLPRPLVKRIKESHIMMIEMDDGMGGTKQYAFAVGGLKL